MYEALILTNRIRDNKRILKELGLEEHSNVLVMSKNQHTFDGLRFEALVLAPDFVIRNDKDRNLIHHLEGVVIKYRGL